MSFIIKFSIYLLSCFFYLCKIYSEVPDKDIHCFLDKYPISYQDILIDNQVVRSGTDLCCSLRYELLKPILEAFDRS